MMIQEEPKIPFKKIFWPSLIAVGIALFIGMIIFFLVLGGIIGSFSLFGSSTFSVKEGSVLHVTLKGKIQEKSNTTFSPNSFMLSESIGLPDILFAIEKAKTDDNIKGIYLDIDKMDAGISSIRAIRQALASFKQVSKKFIIAYFQGEAISQPEYYLGTVANQCYAFPNSTFMLSGLGAEAVFFKNLLDNLEVDVEIVRGENNDFKSAVEPFFLNGLSDSARYQNQVLLSSLWNVVATDITLSRSIKRDSLDAWINNMEIVKPNDALRSKLIDGVMYKDEMLNLIAKKLSLTDPKDIPWADFNAYAKTGFFENQVLTQSDIPQIAVILGEGEVSVDGADLSSKKICQLFRKVRENDGIKAVVFRINSPGGSALASEEIWREVMLTQKKKKVFVSMGDVAASGGYYIATPAERIFAEPTTITGSIGVFGMIPYTGKMLENKLGITFDRVETHAHSNLMSLNRKLTPEELALIQNEVNGIYKQFVSRVATGRKLTMERVNQLARGRVWSGTDAKKIGLVDQLATLPEVIAYAKKAIADQNSEVIYYPEVKEDKFGKLIKMLTSNDGNEDDLPQIRGRAELPETLINWYEQLKRLENKLGIQMRMPYELVVSF